MTDKEMLDLAAKAAGIEGFWWGQDFCYAYNGNLNVPVPWRPLIDDGDALRLAVKLGMRVEVRGEVETEAKYWLKSDGYNYLAEGHFIGSFAATRRAIVRAAAEIGKGM
jgi:hypothetical protein